MARNEQELQHRGQRSDLPLLLPPVLFVLYHQVLVRYGVLEEENGVGKVWERDLYFVHLLEVRRLLVNHHDCPDLYYLQVKRLQHEPRIFSMESRITLVRRGRKMQEVHSRSAYVNTTPCGF